MVSVGVGGKDVSGVTLPILKMGRPFAVKREFRTVSKVPGSSQFLTVAIRTLITAFETLLFSKVGIDWIRIVMLSCPPIVLTVVIDVGGPHYCYVQALGNMNELDMNWNGWPGCCCYVDGYLSSVLFLDVFSLILVSGKGSS